MRHLILFYWINDAEAQLLCQSDCSTLLKNDEIIMNNWFRKIALKFYWYLLKILFKILFKIIFKILLISFWIEFRFSDMSIAVWNFENEITLFILYSSWIFRRSIRCWWKLENPEAFKLPEEISLQTERANLVKHWEWVNLNDRT